MKPGERGRIRTCDPCLKRALLYQLSYAPIILHLNNLAKTNNKSGCTSVAQISKSSFDFFRRREQLGINQRLQLAHRRDALRVQSLDERILRHCHVCVPQDCLNRFVRHSEIVQVRCKSSSKSSSRATQDAENPADIRASLCRAR